MFQGRSLDTIDEMHKSLLCFYTINTKAQLRQADATEKTPLDFWLIAFFPRLGYTGPEVRTMDMHAFGQFIAENRRARGLTQLQLAEALHVTDKAVSKWERGLSFPDVTLLEPLAAKLELTVAELMACRRQERAEQKGAEESMQNLLTISRASVRRERRRSWQRLAAVLVLLAVTAVVVAYTQIVVTEEREDYFVLKETVDGANYLYVELPWEGRLLRLRCVGDVDFDGITLEDEFGCEVVYDLDCRWNRLTYTGTVSRCAPSGSVVVGHMEGSSSGTSSVEVFGMRDVLYAEVDYHQNPHGEGFLCDAAYWLPDGPVDPGLLDVIVDGHPGYPVDYGAALLVVENCVSSTPWDADGDGANEIVVRTRWPEKPYTVYDMLDGEVQAVSWPDAVPEEVRENLMCIWEQ